MAPTLGARIFDRCVSKSSTDAAIAIGEQTKNLNSTGVVDSQTCARLHAGDGERSQVLSRGGRRACLAAVNGAGVFGPSIDRNACVDCRATVDGSRVDGRAAIGPSTIDNSRIGSDASVNADASVDANDRV